MSIKYYYPDDTHLTHLLKWAEDTYEFDDLTQEFTGKLEEPQNSTPSNNS